MRRIYLILIGVLFISLNGCAFTTFKSYCRHQTLFNISVVADHYPEDKIRVARGIVFINGKFIGFHAQAQVFIDGKWEWLEMLGNEVLVGEKLRGFIPTKYVSLEEYYRLMLIWNRSAYEENEIKQQNQ